MTDPSGPLIYIIIGALLIFSAICAGSESAYSSVNKIRMSVLADDNNRKAKLVVKILEHFDKSVITTLIAINVCHVVLSVISTSLLIKLVGEVTGSLLSTIITTLVVFFFAEVLPKNIATANADKWAMDFSYFMYGLMIILTPISFIFQSLLKGTQKAFNLEEDEDVMSEEDFTDVIEKVEDEGIIDENESDIIQAAIEFGDIKVKEILTKRDDIVALDIKDCNDGNIRKFIDKYSYSRIPIYKDSIDNIIGIMHVRTYLKYKITNEKIHFKKMLKKPFFIDKNKMIDEIFDLMQKNRAQIAIVKENDKVIGMITIKDILEELVDDIDDSDDEKRGIK